MLLCGAIIPIIFSFFLFGKKKKRRKSGEKFSSQKKVEIKAIVNGSIPLVDILYLDWIDWIKIIHEKKKG